MEVEQFTIQKLEMQVEGRLIASRNIVKQIKDESLRVLIEFYGGETEFILDTSGRLYQDGEEIANWYNIQVEELKYFNTISNKETSVPAEILLSSFNSLLEEFRNISDKEYHKDWHKYGREQFAKIGKLKIGDKLYSHVTDAVEVETSLHEIGHAIGLEFKFKEESYNIELCNNDTVYFDNKQVHGCTRAINDRYEFKRLYKEYNIFKGRLRDYGIEEKDLMRLITCIADIILYRRGKKRRDSAIDNFIMGEEVKAECARREEERLQQERNILQGQGKTKVDLNTLDETGKPANISNKSLHVMLMMNILSRAVTGINHNNIETIGNKIIEPLYKLGQSKQNKEVLNSLEDYENFYKEQLMTTVNKMGETTREMKSF